MHLLDLNQIEIKRAENFVTKVEWSFLGGWGEWGGNSFSGVFRFEIECETANSSMTRTIVLDDSLKNNESCWRLKMIQVRLKLIEVS
jgi:hypothetical protein